MNTPHKGDDDDDDDDDNDNDNNDDDDDDVNNSSNNNNNNNNNTDLGLIRNRNTSTKLKKPVITGTSSLVTKPVFDKNFKHPCVVPRKGPVQVTARRPVILNEVCYNLVQLM